MKISCCSPRLTVGCSSPAAAPSDTLPSAATGRTGCFPAAPSQQPGRSRAGHPTLSHSDSPRAQGGLLGHAEVRRARGVWPRSQDPSPGHAAAQPGRSSATTLVPDGKGPNEAPPWADASLSFTAWSDATVLGSPSPSECLHNPPLARLQVPQGLAQVLGCAPGQPGPGEAGKSLPSQVSTRKQSA